MTDLQSIRSIQVVDTFFPVIDGVVRTVHNYAKIMNRKSYSCVVCPAAKGGFDDAHLPYDVIRSAALRFPFSDYTVAWPINPFCIKKIDALEDIDIVHFHSPFTQRDSAVNVAKKKGLPMVATFHTKYYDDIYQVTKSRLLAKIVTDSVIHFYDTCDSVWACSEGTAETLRSYGYKGKITVMPNGTSFQAPDNPEELKRKAEKTYRIDPEKNNLLFVGTQVWQKNLKLVLESFKLVTETDPDFRLTIVGTGGDFKAICAYAKKIGLNEEQVHFTGRIVNKDILSGLFLASDLFFFPSTYDNSPLVLREAAVLSKPALLVKGSNSAEVIDPDVNGFLAEENADSMSEKILTIFKDKEILRTAGLNAKHSIPVMWEDIIPKVYETYAEIIDRKKRSS